ncbi:hypothetical protein [Cystobacter fuscus]|uniref:hypothetical protein n=1 Tax=Cystobacter fuscus TaxID=43 RepID=UPI0037C1171F
MAASDAASGLLDFSTPLLCQQLWSGEHQVFHVAVPDLTSQGPTLETCLAEQRVFLEEHLSELAGEQLSAVELHPHRGWVLPALAGLQSLEVSGCSLSDGGTVQQYSWLDNTCQRFHLRPY